MAQTGSPRGVGRVEQAGRRVGRAAVRYLDDEARIHDIFGLDGGQVGCQFGLTAGQAHSPGGADEAPSSRVHQSSRECRGRDKPHDLCALARDSHCRPSAGQAQETAEGLVWTQGSGMDSRNILSRPAPCAWSCASAKSRPLARVECTYSYIRIRRRGEREAPGRARGCIPAHGDAEATGRLMSPCLGVVWRWLYGAHAPAETLPTTTGVGC